MSETEKNFKNKVLKAFLYSGVGNVISKIVVLICVVIVAKELSEENFGVGTLTLACLFILRSVTELSLGVALVQKKEVNDNDYRSAFFFSVLLAAVVTLLMFTFGANLLSHLFGEPQIKDMLLWICGSLLLFSITFVSRAKLERELRFGVLTLVDSGGLLVAALLSVYLAREGYGPWALVWPEVFLRLLQCVVLQTASPYLPRGFGSWTDTKKLLGFGIYASGSRLLYNLYIQADYFVVATFYSKAELGIYSFAYRLVSEPIGALTTAINQVSFPTFSKLQNETEQLRRYFFGIANWSLAGVGAICVVLFVFAESIATSIRPAYVQAVPLIRMFAVVSLVRCVSPLIPQLLNAVGRPKKNFYYSLICVLVLPAAFAVGAQFSLEGVGVAWLIGYPIVSLVLFSFAQKVLEMPVVDFAKNISRSALPLSLAIVPVLAIHYMKLPVWSVVVAAIMSLLVSVGSHYFFSKRSKATT